MDSAAASAKANNAAQEPPKESSGLRPATVPVWPVAMNLTSAA